MKNGHLSDDGADASSHPSPDAARKTATISDERSVRKYSQCALQDLKSSKLIEARSQSPIRRVVNFFTTLRFAHFINHARKTRASQTLNEEAKRRDEAAAAAAKPGSACCTIL